MCKYIFFCSILKAFVFLIYATTASSERYV
jgi:hypothetical protein